MSVSSDDYTRTRIMGVREREEVRDTERKRELRCGHRYMIEKKRTLGR